MYVLEYFLVIYRSSTDVWAVDRDQTGSTKSGGTPVTVVLGLLPSAQRRVGNTGLYRQCPEQARRIRPVGSDHLPSRRGGSDHLPSRRGGSVHSRRGGSDHLPNRRGGSDHLPSRRGGSDHLPSRRGGSDHLPSRRGGSDHLPRRRGGRWVGQDFTGLLSSCLSKTTLLDAP
jgi:hypothetical protein